MSNTSQRFRDKYVILRIGNKIFLQTYVNENSTIYYKADVTDGYLYSSLHYE